MQMLNGTPFNVACTVALAPDGREHAVVVTKATFSIPEDGSQPAPLPTSDDFVYADTFSGEPGLSAVVHESEFALWKARCDVLLVGSAYAPNGRAATSVRVALRVGTMSKAFDVLGERYWAPTVFGTAPSAARDFSSMPISYDRAFGGGEVVGTDPSLRDAYPQNPVGVGFFRRSGDAAILGTRVPNTQEVGAPISSPRGAYRPMSFGPLGRNFQDRIRHAGTYDDTWLASRFPFLPDDFDMQYFQAAPVDQQIAIPTGGEVVELTNLTPRPLLPFRLPSVEMPVEVSTRTSGRRDLQAQLDTIIFEGDRGVFHQIWRAAIPLERGIHDIASIVVGRMSPGWYRARSHGKAYYRGLRHVVAANRERA